MVGSTKLFWTSSVHEFLKLSEKNRMGSAWEVWVHCLCFPFDTQSSSFSTLLSVHNILLIGYINSHEYPLASHWFQTMESTGRSLKERGRVKSGYLCHWLPPCGVKAASCFPWSESTVPTVGPPHTVISAFQLQRSLPHSPGTTLCCQSEHILVHVFHPQV